MFTLSNDELVLSVLDPVADQSLLGSRYCTGGYIWQIEDQCKGPLLTGPQYPSPTPPSFHGQGAPEAFVTPLGNADVPVGETVTVIGVGDVVRSGNVEPFHARDNPTVRRFCSWTVERDDRTVRMTTEQDSGECALTLTRQVSLDGRTITSQTEVVNRCSVGLPLSWFPHPFFPPPADGRCCRFGFSWSLPENAGYFRNDRAELCMKQEYPWRKGLFQRLDISPGVDFSAEIAHPVVGVVSITTDYRVDTLPVWANEVTLSPEPYLGRTVAPDERTAWRIIYRF